MKKILLLPIYLTVALVISNPVFAINSTPTPSSKISPTGDLDRQINDLKERIASRVAELKLVEKKGAIGEVSDVSETQLTILGKNGDISFIDVDELTKFSSPSAKGSFGISDIKKGSTVGVLGLYNKESRRILARFVDVIVLPVIISGVVSDINRDDYSFIITNTENKEFTAEVETFTKTYEYTNPDGLIKSGFSKLQIGERIMIVGFFDINDKSKIISSRIIRFPSLPINPSISVAPTLAPTESPTPTSKPALKTKTSISQ